MQLNYQKKAIENSPSNYKCGTFRKHSKRFLLGSIMQDVVTSIEKEWEKSWIDRKVKFFCPTFRHCLNRANKIQKK